MCGVIGLTTKKASKSVSHDIYDGLSILQHRGQDTCGIATINNHHIELEKFAGRVSTAFNKEILNKLYGHTGIGHVRYPTAGKDDVSQAQPFYSSSPYGIVLAHNGNLVNADKLLHQLIHQNRHLNTNSDSELILNILCHELQKQGEVLEITEKIFKAVEQLHLRCNGGYACVAGIAKVGLIGFRDPNAIRPLSIGIKTDDKGNNSYMLASESCVFNSLGYEFLRNVLAGECVFIDKDMQLHARVCAAKTRFTPCIFEHVYFARPDSVLDGIDIYQVRLKHGEKMAEGIKKLPWAKEIDVIIPIPDTSRVAAQALSESLNICSREGLMKNRYVGRTFIMNNQIDRQKAIRIKLSPITSAIKGKCILLVDDSIVRGNTSKSIIELMKQFGAKKVFMCSASPPVRFQNVYGIDIPELQSLIAHNKEIYQIQEELGADGLYYQTLEDLIDCSKSLNSKIENFECSVFDNNYITKVTSRHLQKVDSERTNSRKPKNSKPLR